MGWRASLMDLGGRAPAARVAWADTAKAISILLLVFWTAVGDRLHLNEMLILVRMPLFFFVSGLFAFRAVTGPSWTEFLRDKVGNLLYLYALWVGLLFLATDVALHLVNGRPLDPGRLLTIFWDPELNIWFLYALALAFLVARLARRLPVALVFAAAAALYLLSVASGEWRHLPFLDRLARLFPFFWLGLVGLPLVARLVERLHPWWPAPAALFLALSWAVYGSPLDGLGVLTFAITLVGIAALLLLARRLAARRWAWPLAVVGASTLYIYVTHKIALFYLDHALALLHVDFPGIDALKVVPVVAAAVLFGRWARDVPWAAWLFAAPWTLRGAPAPVRA